MLKRSNHPVLISLLFVAMMNFAQLTIAQHDADHFGEAHIHACEFCNLAENHEAPTSSSLLAPLIGSGFISSLPLNLVESSATVFPAYLSRAPPSIR